MKLFLPVGFVAAMLVSQTSLATMSRTNVLSDGTAQDNQDGDSTLYGLSSSVASGFSAGAAYFNISGDSESDNFETDLTSNSFALVGQYGIGEIGGSSRISGVGLLISQTPIEAKADGFKFTRTDMDITLRGYLGLGPVDLGLGLTHTSFKEETEADGGDDSEGDATYQHYQIAVGYRINEKMRLAVTYTPKVKKDFKEETKSDDGDSESDDIEVNQEVLTAGFAMAFTPAISGSILVTRNVPYSEEKDSLTVSDDGSTNWLVAVESTDTSMLIRPQFSLEYGKPKDGTSTTATLGGDFVQDAFAAGLAVGYTTLKEDSDDVETETKSTLLLVSGEARF